MSSTDDDEPLAVVAAKVKEMKELTDKKGKKKDVVKKRKIQTESSESVYDESDDARERRRHKKRKPPLEDEFDSDEIPLGDMSDDAESKSDNDAKDGKIGSLAEEETNRKEEKEISSENDGTNNGNPSENVSENVVAKPSTSSPETPPTKVAKTKEKCGQSSDTSAKGDVESKSDSTSSDESHKDNKSDNDRSKRDGKEEKNKEEKVEAEESKRRKFRKKKSDIKKRSGKKGRSKKEKNKEATQSQDAASIRLTKLKKMVTLAGIRIVYKKIFEDVGDSDRQRVKALEKEMERRGLTPPFTMESCKAFKLRKEQEAELAELAKNEIIEIGENPKGRVTRGQRSAALASRRRGGIIFEESSNEDEEEVEEREHMKQETQNMFKNLRGIVSDDADSD